MKETIDDVVETLKYDEMEDKLIVKRSQDLTPYIDANKAERDATPEFGKYGQMLTKTMTLPVIFIEQMMTGQCCPDGKKYNLLSADPEERKRALLHVQTEHKAGMTINGKPFAKKRMTWH